MRCQIRSSRMLPVAAIPEVAAMGWHGWYGSLSNDPATVAPYVTQMLTLLEAAVPAPLRDPMKGRPFGFSVASNALMLVLTASVSGAAGYMTTVGAYGDVGFIGTRVWVGDYTAGNSTIVHEWGHVVDHQYARKGYRSSRQVPRFLDPFNGSSTVSWFSAGQSWKAIWQHAEAIEASGAYQAAPSTFVANSLGIYSFRYAWANSYEFFAEAFRAHRMWRREQARVAAGEPSRQQYADGWLALLRSMVTGYEATHDAWVDLAIEYLDWLAVEGI